MADVVWVKFPSGEVTEPPEYSVQQQRVDSLLQAASGSQFTHVTLIGIDEDAKTICIGSTHENPERIALVLSTALDDMRDRAVDILFSDADKV